MPRGIHICRYPIFAAIFAVAAAFGQSPAPSPSASGNPRELQRQVQQLKQENQQLKQENQRLRELLTQGNTTKPTTTPAKPATARSVQTAPPGDTVRDVPIPPGLVDWSLDEPAANTGKGAGGKAAGQRKATAGSNDQQSLTHWLTTSSNKRHNSSCRWFKNSNGRPCRANEGIPCKICGG
jgi:hypothetical protein